MTAPDEPGAKPTGEAAISRPAWLLALVVTIFVSGLVFLEYAQRPVVNLMTLAVPTLAALYVVSRVEKRSDDQDAKLKTIERATNGELTQRLDDAVQPIHDELRLLREALARNHPDDPLAVAAKESGVVPDDTV